MLAAEGAAAGAGAGPGSCPGGLPPDAGLDVEEAKGVWRIVRENDFFDMLRLPSGFACP